MYDDSWFQPVLQNSRPHSEAGHKRRVSLLTQPNEDDRSNNTKSEVPATIREPVLDPPAPPLATLFLRAASYSDFHYISRAQLREKDEGRGETCRLLRRERRRSEALEPPVIETAASYDTTSEELLDVGHDKYKLYLQQLQASRAHLDSLVQDTNGNLDLLAALTASFDAVGTQSETFQTRCNTLLTEQKRLSSLVDEVDYNLQYYSYLDPITRRLNAPGMRHFVRGDDFSQMLSQLDDCLAYMDAHPKHRESATYLSRYRLLLTRGLTLIRVYFTNSLSETAADVSKRIADRQLNDNTMPALLYAKFRVHAPELKRLAAEIQKRATPPAGSEAGTEGEYQSLVNELHQSYSAARGRLIIPLARKKLAEIDIASSTSKDLVSFARSSINYIRGVCLDEYELWQEWFNSDEGIYDFLEAVCEPLYDYLRPKIIRETQLPKLCELCYLLQVRPLDQEDEEFELQISRRLDFQTLVTSVLEDSQTRLVFLALTALRNDIERFSPMPEDLNYPAKSRSVALSGKRVQEPALSGKKDTMRDERPLHTATASAHDHEDNTDDPDLKWRNGSEASQTWYPTLQKAIWLLSKIYRLINSTVFDDLAHQIVHQTTLSLVRASEHIGARATPFDCQLFLLKQLLILKQQIVAFDIEFVTPEVDVDFSSITNTFWELRDRGTLFDPRNIVRFLGSNMIPRVVENMLDAKGELDSRLRAVITDFTNSFASRMTAPIAENASSNKDFDAASAVREVRSNVEKESVTVRAKLDEYLDDDRTKETLAGAVQDQVLANYDEYFDKYVLKAKANGGRGPLLSNKGKGRQDDVWDPDTFADWTMDVFALANGDIGLQNNGEESSPALSRTMRA